MFDRATRCHLVDKHTSVALTCRLPCREQMNLFAICLQAQVDVLAAGFALCSSCLSLSLICADSGPKCAICLRHLVTRAQFAWSGEPA